MWGELEMRVWGCLLLDLEQQQWHGVVICVGEQQLWLCLFVFWLETCTSETGVGLAVDLEHEPVQGHQAGSPDERLHDHLSRLSSG